MIQSKANSIERICTRASVGTIIATILLVLLSLSVASYQDFRLLRESEKKRLTLTAPLLIRALSGEMMVGDERAVLAMKAQLQRDFGLTSVEISSAPVECFTVWNSSCWAGQIPEIQPARFLKISAPINEKRLTTGFSLLLWCCIPLLLLGMFITYRIKRELQRSVVRPIQTLAKNPEEWTPEGEWVAAEALSLRSRLMEYINERDAHRDERERLSLQASLGEIASQVAHDIRSPLAALEMVASSTAHLPEDTRIIVRDAIGRIGDIANNLLARNEVLAGSSGAGEGRTVQLLSSLIDALVSEKRMQTRTQLKIEIESNVAHAYGVFAEVQVAEFKRALSNILNNAVESLSSGGKVIVSLSADQKMAEIRVSDTGKGIPFDVLPKLGKRGETHDKKGGSGLGLYHARNTVESWGGALKIASEPGKGTAVTLVLPRVSSPPWFVPELEVPYGGTIVVLDDDGSIHRVWESRFEEIVRQARVNPPVHLSTPSELSEWLNRNQVGKLLSLIDYELLGFAETGLDLIESHNLQRCAILVTSRFEDVKIQERCRMLGVRLIPKGMAPFVPIKLSERDRVRWDAILIDDDPLVHALWKSDAKQKKKHVLLFFSAADFLQGADMVSEDTPIYVDSSLGSDLPGEQSAKRLYDRGFKELFLATGYPAKHFRESMPWLKGIVGKEPPFC